MRQTHFRAALALTTVTLLAACGDARLDKLALGISRDSATALIGDKPHRTLNYLTAGTQWEVVLYSRKASVETDSIPWRDMSPVILIGNKTVGWGWGWWGGTSAKQGIAMPK